MALAEGQKPWKASAAMTAQQLVNGLSPQTLDLAVQQQEDRSTPAQKSPTFAAPSLKDIAVMEDEKPLDSMNDSPPSKRAVVLDKASGLQRIQTENGVCPLFPFYFPSA